MYRSNQFRNKFEDQFEHVKVFGGALNSNRRLEM